MTHLQYLPFYYIQHFSPGVHSSRPKLRLLQTSSIPFTYKYGYDEDEVMEEVPGRTNISHLYPEILTMIFSKLDLQSKGRVAQV